MLANSKLSITIPTYNRADFLDASLKFHVPFLKDHNIAIYISDNSSSDDTKLVAEKWIKEYPLIHYHCNESNVGPDANFEMALRLPTSKYVWLLGDTYILPEEGIRYILAKLDDGISYDAIVFNLLKKVDIQTKDYADNNLLLTDLSGLMSCLSCLIYNEKLIEQADFSRYYNSNFIQTGIIFEFISNKNARVHWVQNHTVELLQHHLKPKKSWRETPQAIEIGVERWLNFIFSLPPSYSLENKLIAAKSFGVASNLLKLRGLLSMRADGALTFRRLIKYRQAFILSTGVAKFLLALGLCLIPVFLLAKVKKIAQRRS